ncbi:MAG: Smr/MutS family protein [Pseudomonadota bacterium]
MDDIEKELFRTAMKGVKPLILKKRITVPPPKPRPVAKKPDYAAEDEDKAQLSDHEYLTPLTSDSLVAFKRTGIQHKVLRNLRAGQYNVEAILDMHGMTVAEAKDSLSIFLSQCQQEGVCHVLIIHGKGSASSHPILKNKLNHWLRDLAQVLAFCSATAKDGRSGAMYVLLKKIRGDIRER